MLELGSKNDRQPSTLDNVGGFLRIAHDSVPTVAFATIFLIDVVLEPVYFANLPFESFHIISRSAFSFYFLEHVRADQGNLILTSSEHVFAVFGKHYH